MTPPHIHINLDDRLSRAGKLPSRIVSSPGTQGAGVLGIHGMGVSTPKAAAVAAATVGFAGDMHMPRTHLPTEPQRADLVPLPGGAFGIRFHNRIALEDITRG